MIEFSRFRDEILDFICTDTLRAIDWGILDLSPVKDLELKGIFHTIEVALTLELERNYRQNDTGIFRVSLEGGIWYYTLDDCTIEAESLGELEKIVKGQRLIWYVFDENMVERLEVMGMI